MKKKSAQTFSHKNFLQVTILFLFFIAYFFVSYHFQLFTAQTISCQLAQEQCSEPVLAELNRLQGTFFFSPTISKTTSKILNSDPNIDSIQVEKQFPHTLSFSLQRKTPLAQIRCESINLLVNTDGKVEENIRELYSDIQSIKTSQILCDTLLGQGRLDMNTLHVLMSFTQFVNQQTPELILTWQDFDTVVVITPDQKRIVLPLNQLQSTFQMYKYLLEQQQLSEDWIELDLRFQKAIVKTQ